MSHAYLVVGGSHPTRALGQGTSCQDKLRFHRVSLFALGKICDLLAALGSSSTMNQPGAALLDPVIKEESIYSYTPKPL